MLDLDIEQFWKDEALAHQDNCFAREAPQVALGIRMSDECVFAELGEDGKPWGITPRERRMELNKRYNDKAEKIVGRRLLRETYPEPAELFPGIRAIGELFGGQYTFDGNTTWLHSDCQTEKMLEQILDDAERILDHSFREFALPANWETEKKRIHETYGKTPGLFQAIRGPVTLATSIYGVENLIFLLYDAPDLACRFRDVITKAIRSYILLFAEEAGYDSDSIPSGFSFCDDDCNLLTPELYEWFGYPILRDIFDFVSPAPEDYRYQHSDSAMGHLLPILGRLNLTACNFGPTVTITEIRRYLPRTRIDGQLAPFTFMNNDEQAIIREVKRDCEMAKASGIKGLNFCTAGSINNGSLLTSMRVVMAAIQQYGRYD